MVLGKDSGILHWVVSQGNLLQLISQLSPGFPEYLEDFWWAMENLSWWCWGPVFPDKMHVFGTSPKGPYIFCVWEPERFGVLDGSGSWDCIDFCGFPCLLWLLCMFCSSGWVVGHGKCIVGGLNKVLLFMRIVQVFGTSPKRPYMFVS